MAMAYGKKKTAENVHRARNANLKNVTTASFVAKKAISRRIAPTGGTCRRPNGAEDGSFISNKMTGEIISPERSQATACLMFGFLLKVQRQVFTGSDDRVL